MTPGRLGGGLAGGGRGAAGVAVVGLLREWVGGAICVACRASEGVAGCISGFQWFP